MGGWGASKDGRLSQQAASSSRAEAGVGMDHRHLPPPSPPHACSQHLCSRDSPIPVWGPGLGGATACTGWGGLASHRGAGPCRPLVLGLETPN